MNVSAFINRVKESDHVGFPRKVKRYFTLKRLVEKKKFLAEFAEFAKFAKINKVKESEIL